MPLGMLAKDSIQDLEALGREAEREEKQRIGKQSTQRHKDSAQPQQEEFLDARDEEEASVTSFHSTNEEISPLEETQQQHQQQQQIVVGATEAPQKRPSEGESSGVGSVGSDHNHGKYSGFSSAYHHDSYYSDGDYYGMPSYAPPTIGEKPANGFLQSLLPCLFPWTSTSTTAPPEVGVPELLAKDSLMTDDGSVAATDSSVPVVDKKLSRSLSNGENDDVSTGSDALGERLSNKERQAVLARLRLAQPEAGEESPVPEETTAPDPSQKKRGLLNDLPAYDPLSQPAADETSKPPARGILKRGSVVSLPSKKQLEKPNEGGSNKSNNTRIQPSRRSLFPKTNYEHATTNGEKRPNGKNVGFAPMARVVTVKSKNDMNPFEKSSIWWQKADYEDFRKTGRIITKAMLEGGSELWLNSERCNGKSGSFHSKDKSSESGDTITATGDKWWHKFGHSRRGLEHVVSMEEGRQRQLNVRSAIRAVVDEQTRQRMYNRKDPEKLRMVSLQYTSWARDLALASGSSDADAVQSEFAEARKTREFYLLKMARGTGPSASSSGRLVPEFMQPALHGVNPTAPHRLDANTSAQIRYRRQSQRMNKTLNKSSSTSSSTSSDGNKGSFNTDAEVSEPVHDTSNRVDDGEPSMARKAAGFSAAEEKTDMSAVLSGMGAVPRSSQVVSTA